jgi:hypothetical protein
MGVSGQHHALAALYPRYPLYRRLGGPRAGLDTEVRGKILCPCRGSNPDRPVVQPVVRHYTAWANLAPKTEISSAKVIKHILKFFFSHFNIISLILFKAIVMKLHIYWHKPVFFMYIKVHSVLTKSSKLYRSSYLLRKQCYFFSPNKMLLRNLHLQWLCFLFPFFFYMCLEAVFLLMKTKKIKVQIFSE